MRRMALAMLLICAGCCDEQMEPCVVLEHWEEEFEIEVGEVDVPVTSAVTTVERLSGSEMTVSRVNAAVGDTVWLNLCPEEGGWDQAVPGL